MAYLERSTRVGRSQGASIFWGLVSVCFAAAACFYYWKNHENETTARVMRDQVLELKEQNETLNSQKDHLQASKSEAEEQLKTREDLVQEKETELAAEETRLETLGHQSQSQSDQNQAQVMVVKKFNDVIRKLGKDVASDVVERGGRPVLRVPNSALFAAGDATLKSEGKALLNQITLALNDQLDNFELRVVSYTDTDMESDASAGTKTDPPANPEPGPGSEAKAHYANSWDLTAARAATLGRYYRDQTTLPFLNVLVLGRGDSEPIVPNAKEGHARNRRVEITVTPLPGSFRPPETDKTSSGNVSDSAKPASHPAPAKEKPKDKKSESDKNPGF